MKVLVLGAKGYVGSNICKYFTKSETVSDSYTDVTKINQIFNSIKKHRPDWCINACACVDEDRAEEDLHYWSDMISVNIVGAINCLKVCQIENINYLHIRSPFELSVLDDYSLSKASAYRFIKAEKYKHMVLSVMGGWYFGGINSRQFDSLLVKSIKEKFPLGITNNSKCTPLWMPDFSKELEKCIINDVRGEITISGNKSCTRFEFAKCLAEKLGKTMEELNWKEDNNYPEVARRPDDWQSLSTLPNYEDRMENFINENFTINERGGNK